MPPSVTGAVKPRARPFQAPLRHPELGNALAFRIARDLALDAADDCLRRPGRGDEPVPEDGREIGDAGLGEGRHLREHGRALGDGATSEPDQRYPQAKSMPTPVMGGTI